MMIDEKKLCTQINLLLGTDIEVPGRGIGFIIARACRLWCDALETVPSTPEELEDICRQFALRDPKTFAAVRTHYTALLTLLRDAGVSNGWL